MTSAKYLSLLAFSVVAIAALAGCSADAQHESNNANGIELPAKNIDQWVMPLDEFSASLSIDNTSAYADALLIQPCMDEKGFVRSVPRPDLTDGRDNLRRVFDPTTAAKYGYHSARAVNPPSGDWAAYAARTLSPQEQAAFDACDAKNAKVTAVPVGEINFSLGLASAAFEATLVDQKVVAAARKWRTCMRPKGIVDLPPDPGQMPSPSVAKQFNLAAISRSATIVTQAEKSLATFDAKCRDSSGYTKTRYDVEWAKQVTALGENGVRLKEIRANLTSLNKKLTNIITQHAPAS